MDYEGAPEHYGGSQYQTPAPKNVEIGKINFTIPAGYFEDDNPEKINLPESISNHVINSYQKSFKQNDLLLVNIAVFELDDNVDLNVLNDGTYTINLYMVLRVFLKVLKSLQQQFLLKIPI